METATVLSLRDYERQLDALASRAEAEQWEPSQVADCAGLRNSHAFPRWGTPQAHAERWYTTLSVSLFGERRFSLEAFEPLAALLPGERMLLQWQLQDERRHATWQQAAINTLVHAYGPFPLVHRFVTPEPRMLASVLDRVRREAATPLEHIILSQFLLENTAVETLQTFVTTLPQENPVKALFLKTFRDEERHTAFGRLFVAYHLPRVSVEQRRKIAASIQAIVPLYIRFIISMSDLPDRRPAAKYIEYVRLFGSMCRGFEKTNAVLRQHVIPPVPYRGLLGEAMAARLARARLRRRAAA